MILNKIVCLFLSSVNRNRVIKKFDIANLEDCLNDRDVRAKLEKYIKQIL